jgi:membrane protein
VRAAHLPKAVALAMIRDDAFVDASAMAFSLFLASIPLMALAGNVVAHVLHGEPSALTLLSRMVDLAPQEVRSLIDRNIARGTDQNTAPFFLMGALWLSATAFHDAMTVFERALDARRRSWIHKRIIALGCVVALMGLLALAGSAVVVSAGGSTALLRFLLEPVTERRPGVIASTVAALATGALVAAFFRIAVRHRMRRPRLWPGSVTTVALGALASYGFARYARSLASYALFYGSLAAVAVFLLWLWIMCIALLVGVELNACLERGEAALGAGSD